MVEGIKLKIDHKGAKVENEAVMILARGAVMPLKHTKNIILNQPFWVVMKEKKNLPYFCAYVVEPEEEYK